MDQPIGFTTSGLRDAGGSPVKYRREKQYCRTCGGVLSSYNRSGMCFSREPCEARARDERLEQRLAEAIASSS